MNDFSASIESIRRPDGSINLDLAGFGFTADFCDATAPLGEIMPIPRGLPIPLMHQRGFVEQVLRAKANHRRSGKAMRYEYLSPSDVLKSHAAVEFANSIGHLMNVELTFVPHFIGLMSEQEIETAFCSLMKRYSSQCERWTVKPLYIAVFENSTIYGLHVHMMLSLPEHLGTAFKVWVSNTCMHLPGMKCHSKRICHTEFRKTPSVHSQWKWWRYLAKGLCPTSFYDKRTADGWLPDGLLYEMIGLKPRNPGRVGVKRVRISEAISVSRQREAGYRSAWDRGAATPSDWCSDVMYLRKLQEGLNGLKSL